VIESGKRIVEAESSATRSSRPPLFEIKENDPATVNNAEASDRVRAAHEAALPSGSVVTMGPSWAAKISPSMVLSIPHPPVPKSPTSSDFGAGWMLSASVPERVQR
jgi:hypothetical protein